MAPEYYDDLAYHTSWCWVLWQFVTNPAIGPYARIKRKARYAPVYEGQNMLTEYWEAVSPNKSFSFFFSRLL